MMDPIPTEPSRPQTPPLEESAIDELNIIEARLSAATRILFQLFLVAFGLACFTSRSTTNASTNTFMSNSQSHTNYSPMTMSREYERKTATIISVADFQPEVDAYLCDEDNNRYYAFHRPITHGETMRICIKTSSSSSDDEEGELDSVDIDEDDLSLDLTSLYFTQAGSFNQEIVSVDDEDLSQQQQQTRAPQVECSNNHCVLETSIEEESFFMSGEHSVQSSIAVKVSTGPMLDEHHHNLRSSSNHHEATLLSKKNVHISVPIRSKHMDPVEAMWHEEIFNMNA